MQSPALNETVFDASEQVRVEPFPTTLQVSVVAEYDAVQPADFRTVNLQVVAAAGAEATTAYKFIAVISNGIVAPTADVSVPLHTFPFGSHTALAVRDAEEDPPKTMRPTGAAQDPSPRQKVELLADVPPLRFVTGRLSVTPLERLTCAHAGLLLVPVLDR